MHELYTELNLLVLKLAGRALKSEVTEELRDELMLQPFKNKENFVPLLQTVAINEIVDCPEPVDELLNPHSCTVLGGIILRLQNMSLSKVSVENLAHMLAHNFKLVQLSGIPAEPGRIYDKWNNVVEGGKYPNLSKVVKNALTISHRSVSIN